MIGRVELPLEGEFLTYFSVEFHRADCPPKDDRPVLCTDGIRRVAIGFYVQSEAVWRGVAVRDDLCVIPQISIVDFTWVKGWAELPDAAESIADCYPNRRCRVCGCTRDRGCEGGCSWVEWDLCSACEGMG
jgi:hypothetical protein